MVQGLLGLREIMSARPEAVAAVPADLRSITALHFSVSLAPLRPVSATCVCAYG
jgi:hypothetical protein